MGSIADQNRQSVLFVDGNLNISTKGWKSEYVPTERVSKQNELQLLGNHPSTVTVQNIPPMVEKTEMCEPIEAKTMPVRNKAQPLNCEIINNIQAAQKVINIPIQRLDLGDVEMEDVAKKSMNEMNERNSNNNRHKDEDIAKAYLEEILPGKKAEDSPLLENQAKSDRNMNVVCKEINLPPAQSKNGLNVNTIWDKAPLQAHKPCKKPKDQAEWDAILNANLAGMAENEEEFTKEFLANLLGGPAVETQGVRGRKNSVNQREPCSMRAPSPGGLRSAPKAPTCWACGEPVALGMKVLKIKGYPMHPECFVCSTCFLPLKTSSVFISNDRLFCREHIKFGPKAIRPLSRGPTPEFTEF